MCISSKAPLSCRYFDSVPQFDWSVTELCLFNNTFVNFTYSRWCYLLSKFNQRWISPNNLERFSNTLYRKGTVLENCWKFVDGKVQVICCPGTNQRVLYNGHKREHSTKYQTAGVSNGLYGHLIGPFEGKKHDALIFYELELLQDLQQVSVDTNGNILCIYRDPAYIVRLHLQGLFGGAILNIDQRAWNEVMNYVRVSVSGH